MSDDPWRLAREDFPDQDERLRLERAIEFLREHGDIERLVQFLASGDAISPAAAHLIARLLHGEPVICDNGDERVFKVETIKPPRRPLDPTLPDRAEDAALFARDLIAAGEKRKPAVDEAARAHHVAPGKVHAVLKKLGEREPMTRAAACEADTLRRAEAQVKEAFLRAADRIYEEAKRKHPEDDR